jgi:hypothetical protein
LWQPSGTRSLFGKPDRLILVDAVERIVSLRLPEGYLPNLKQSRF